MPLVSQLPVSKKNVIEKAVRTVGKLVDQIITDQESDQPSYLSNSVDILGSLLPTVNNKGQSFTNQEIKEESLTFVFPGSETPGNLLEWMLYVHMTNDSVLKACREEVDRVLPNGIQPTDEHLSELVICEAVINETVRLYPPAAFISQHCIREPDNTYTCGSNCHYQ